MAEPRTFPYKFSSTFFLSSLSLSGKSVSRTCAPKRAAMQLKERKRKLQAAKGKERNRRELSNYPTKPQPEPNSTTFLSRR